jgi:hypothetical protein
MGVARFGPMRDAEEESEPGIKRRVAREPAADSFSHSPLLPPHIFSRIPHSSSAFRIGPNLPTHLCRYSFRRMMSASSSGFR